MAGWKELLLGAISAGLIASEVASGKPDSWEDQYADHSEKMQQERQAKGKEIDDAVRSQDQAQVRSK